MTYVERKIKDPGQSFFLFGPRGAGKSTWLKHTFPHAIYIDLLQPDVLRSFLAYPERLREIVAAEEKQKVFIIDEIQKVPDLLPQVHALIEKNKGLQFILTGSSARKLRRANANLLGGRALFMHMHPFSAFELQEKFSLTKALQFGLLPLVYDSKNPKEVLNSYAGLYLKEEVQMDGLVRNSGGFARVMEMLAFSHASLLNTTNIARECYVKRSTVENYIQIMEDLLLTFSLPVFTKRAKRNLSARSKFYFFDPGVFASLRLKGPMDQRGEIEGLALEGLVAEHLRSWIDLQRKSYSLSFWRTRAGLEVDFIVYGEGGFLAIEVKNSTFISPNDLKGLKAFQQDYPESKAILLYRGKEKIKKENVLCVPCEEFLTHLLGSERAISSSF